LSLTMFFSGGEVKGMYY